MKVSVQAIGIGFVCVFPILPVYFSIFGFSGITLVPLIGLVFVLLIKKGLIVTRYQSIFLLFATLIMWGFCKCTSLIMTHSYMQTIYFLIQIIGIASILSASISNREVFLKMINTIVKTSGIVAIFGIIEGITEFNVFSLLNTTGSALNYNTRRFGVLRIISFSSQTIVYGVYLMFCMALTLYLFQFTKKTATKRKVYVVIYCLQWVNVLLTFSRSSIIATAFSQLLILYFSGIKELLKKLFKIVTIGAVAMFSISIVFPQLGRVVQNALYMVLALFDDNYSSLISASFGTNLDATGDRVRLYQWVKDSMTGHWLFGHGELAQFEYNYQATNGIYQWTATKYGIEVHYLNLIYHYGLVGMIPEVFVYVQLLLKAFINREKATWEPKIGFITVCLSIFLAYFIQLFAVNQSSDKNIFYVLVMLFIIYIKKGKFEEHTGGDAR